MFASGGTDASSSGRVAERLGHGPDAGPVARQAAGGHRGVLRPDLFHDPIGHRGHSFPSRGKSLPSSVYHVTQEGKPDSAHVRSPADALTFTRAS